MVAAAEIRRRRSPALNVEAAMYVRDLIMSGQMQPGQYLRPDALADELEMSATPVREALLSLRGEGFVLLEPRRGFLVAPLSGNDIRDLFTAQALLAGELAARTSERISEDTLAKLDGLQEQLREAAASGTVDQMEDLNHDFHRVLNLAADSPKLAWALSVATRYVPRRFYPTIAGWPEASAEDHLEILSALRAHEPVRARTAMAKHVINAGQLLADHLDQVRLGADA